MQIFIMPRSYHGLWRRAEFAPRARARPPGRSPSTGNAPARSRDDANATSPSGTRPRIRPDRLEDATLRADETAGLRRGLAASGRLPNLVVGRGDPARRRRRRYDRAAASPRVLPRVVRRGLIGRRVVRM